MRRAVHSFAAVLALGAAAGGARAQAPDSERAALRRAVWDGMAGLERLEIAAARRAGTTRRPRPDSVAARRAETLDRVTAALDRMVFAEPWGPDELERLRQTWPESALLETYAARLAERSGDPAGALATVDRLLRASPAEPELQRMRGRLLERLGRPAEASDAFARALDLAPEDEATFRSLQRLAEAQGKLADALAQIRRLRIRLPDSRALADHETELLQRLGAAPGPRPAPSSPERDRT